MRCRIALTALFSGAVWVWSVCAAVEQAAEPNRKATTKSTPSKDGAPTDRDPIFNGPALSITGVIQELMGEIRAGSSQTRLKRILDARKVDFPRTPENLDTLSRAGVPEWLLEMIRRAAGPPLPELPPPPPTPKATLEVTCQPKECDFRLEGLDPRPTLDGKHTFRDLKPGKFSLDVAKPGYALQQHEFVINEGSNRMSFTLLPDGDSQAKFGTDLRNEMLKTLGGDAGRKDMLRFRGSGKLQSFSPDEVETRWNFRADFRADGAMLEAENSGGILTLDCTVDGICKPRPATKKAKWPPNPQNLQTSLDALYEYRLTRMIGLINAASTSASAMAAQIPPDGEQQFQVRAADHAKYEVVLDWKLRPSSITLESGTGLGSGRQLAFDNYIPVGAGQLPQTVVIKFPNSKQGVRVQFTELKAF